MNQDPKLIRQFKGEVEQKQLFNGDEKIGIAASAHNIEGKEYYAVTDGEDISVLDANFKVIEYFKKAVTEDCVISKLDFIQPNDSTLLLLSSSYDEGRINIFTLSKYL